MTQLRVIIILFLAATALGCSSGLGGRTGSPFAAAVDEPVIARDAASPQLLVIPERVTLKSKDSVEITEGELIPCEEFLTAMLTSALARVGNMTLIDSDYASQPQRRAAAGFAANRLGPYRIRVQLTEMNQFAEVDESGFDPWRFDSGWDYLKLPITTVAFWVSILTGIPTVYVTTSVKGVVGLDVSAIDERSGEVVASFPIQGTHFEKGRQIGNPLFGTYSKSEARSTLSGASRAAINSAVKQILEQLSRRKG